MSAIRESVEGSDLDRIHAAIAETITARHLTFEMSDSPLVPTEDEPTSRATGYVNLGEKVIDAHILTIFPAAGLDENSPPAASKASGTTLYVELDSETATWDSMTYSGLGESLVAVLYWLRSVTTAVPTARAGDYAVDMDFRNIVADPGVDVRTGIEAAGLAGTVLQAQVHLDEQGLIANIASVLPERILPDGLRVDSRVLALSLAPSAPRAVVLPANASGTSVEELTDRRTEDCRLGTTEHVAGDKPLRSHFSEGRSRVVTALNALDEQHAFDTETREAMAAALGEAVKTSKFGDDPQRVTEILLEALDGSRDW